MAKACNVALIGQGFMGRTHSNQGTPHTNPPKTAASEPAAPRTTLNDGHPLRLDSLYLESMDSPLSRFMSGEPLANNENPDLRPGQAVYACQPTGNFNLGATPDILLFERYCVKRESLSQGVLDGFYVEDDEAPALKGKPHFYRIAFDHAVIEVRGPAVRLHYESEDGLQTVDLARQPGRKYAFSFENLVPDKVVPDTQDWVMDQEEAKTYRSGN